MNPAQPRYCNRDEITFATGLAPGRRESRKSGSQETGRSLFKVLCAGATRFFVQYTKAVSEDMVFFNFREECFI